MESKVLKLIKKGIKREKIRIQLGLTPYEIDKVITSLAKQGIVKKEGRRRYTPEEDELIIKMCISGASIKKIGEVINRSTAAATNRICWLRKRGAEI